VASGLPSHGARVVLSSTTFKRKWGAENTLR
jgi:hypothetical protein